MKNIIILLCLIACSLAAHNLRAESIVKENNWREKFGLANNNVMVIAHRACWRLAPENSLQAIKACIDNDVDMVEIDIQRTKDGHLVVMHDLSVDRMTNGTGLVKDFTFTEIRKLKLKEFDGGDNALLTDQIIPTLKEAFAATKGVILVNLDAKADIRDQAYAEAKEVGMLDQILIKNFITEPTEELKNFNFYGNTFFMPIIREKEDGDLASIIKNFDSEPQIAYEVIYSTESNLKSACLAAQQQGSGCWLNTLWESLSPGHSDDKAMENPSAHWGHVINELGVNMIQTDRPVVLVEYLKSLNLHH